MHLVILLMLVGALALLVLALVGGNSALAACSIAVSLIAVGLIVRARQRRAERARAGAAEAERLARIEAEQDEATRLLAAATAEASRRAAAAPIQQGAGDQPAAPSSVAGKPSRAAGGSGPPPGARTLITDDLALFDTPAAGPAEFAVPAGLTVPAVERPGGRVPEMAQPAEMTEPAAEMTVPAQGDEPPAAEPAQGDEMPTTVPAQGDEPPAAETVAPLERHGQARVWVIDGRPRYHLAECRHLDGSAEPISLSQAVEDGFTPCADCDPDNRITN